MTLDDMKGLLDQITKEEKAEARDMLLRLADWIKSEVASRSELGSVPLPAVSSLDEALARAKRVNASLDQKIEDRDNARKAALKIAEIAFNVLVRVGQGLAGV
jgi:hypothetical protein